MCVSAETSFSLTACLVPVGLYCLRQASQRDHAALPLAAVPLLFGVQQFCEGLVWLGIGRSSPPLTRNGALLYLFFALLFWLFWIPFSCLCLEPRRGRSRAMWGCALLGLTGGVSLYLPILVNPELLEVQVVGQSLEYNMTRTPGLEVIPQVVWHLAYLGVIALPLTLLTPRHRGLALYSTALVLSATISHVYFLYAFASIWCLFAAILSLILGYVFHHLPRTAAVPPLAR